MWAHHVPTVAQEAERLSQLYQANADLAVTGAWLHDFGDAFLYRFDDQHDDISRQKAIEVLEQVGYSPVEIQQILQEIIAPHSCRPGNLPTTLEGKILATADAIAHLKTQFYVHLTWMHIPEGLTFDQFLDWVAEKLERDFHTKMFFDQEREEVRHRYDILREIFVKHP